MTKCSTKFEGLQRCINTIQPLNHTLAEEQQLGSIIASGNGTAVENAKWELVRGTILYIVKMVKDICPTDEEMQKDLFGEAMLKAYRAADKYNGTSNSRFATFFSQYLKRELLSWKSINSCQAKTTAEMQKYVYQYNSLNDKRENPMTAEEFAAIADISRDYAMDVVMLATNKEPNISIDCCYSLGDDENYGEDVSDENDNIIGHDTTDCGSVIDRKFALNQLNAWLDANLRGREKEMKKYAWLSHYGLGKPIKTNSQLATELGKTVGAIGHMIARINDIAENMPQSLRLLLKETLG